MRRGRWRYLIRTIRVRVLAIVIIPAAALLVIGVGLAGYLVHQGQTAQNWADEVRAAVPAGVDFTTQADEERRLSLLTIAGDKPEAGQLAAQRTALDSAITRLRAQSPPLIDVNSVVLSQLPAVRGEIDGHQLSVDQAYDYYNNLISLVDSGLRRLARAAPDAASATEVSTAIELYGVAEAMNGGNALAAAAVAGTGLTSADLQEYAMEVGHYHMELEALLPRLTTDEQAFYATLTSGTAWQHLSQMETALIQRGPSTDPAQNGALPMGMTDWQANAREVSADLINLWSQHQQYALDLAARAGRQTFVNSGLAGGAVLVVVVFSLLLATRVASRLIRKLRSLRTQTMDLAEHRLPAIVDRLRAGEQVDVHAELPPLDFGRDEIGSVATAFNHAQRTAISAAVAEAATREGTHAVFLNIAHRSQVVVHRQLAVLDKAERTQDDPEQLELLFQLDHLATRARRNAENLIILGGEQPGRQWRNPVPLLEIVRGAVAETEQYARVRIGSLPQVALVGAVVADLGHLLAELVDNATTFSPPDSVVAVRGNLVGKGVVLEVEDRGLGIPDEERERINHLLREPPDFGMRALSDDSRLGLFVVSRLAARHAIEVTLNESNGGTRAVSLLPATLMASTVDSPAPAEPVPNTDTSGPGGLPRRRRKQSSAPAEPAPAEPPVAWPAEDAAPPAEAPAVVPAVVPPAAGPDPVTDLSVAEAPTMEQPVVESAVVDSSVAEAPVAEAPLVEMAEDPDRPPLPRRQRQASLSPLLASNPGPPPDEPQSLSGRRPESDALSERTPEQARNTMAAFQRGTRKAREAPDP